MTIRQAGQSIAVRTSAERIKQSGSTIRTNRTAAAATGNEREMAETTLIKSMSPKEVRQWQNLPLSLKENYLAEVVSAIRAESAMQRRDTIRSKGRKRREAYFQNVAAQGQTTEPRRSAHGKENADLPGKKEQESVSKQAMNAPVKSREDGVAALKANPGGSKDRMKPKTRFRERKNRAGPVAATAVVSAAVNSVRKELRTEEANERRKHSMLNEVITAGIRDIVPVSFIRKKAVTGRASVGAIRKTASFAGSVFKPFLMMMGLFLLIIVLIIVILFPGSLHDNTVSMEGLPAMISEEMVSAAIEMRDEYDQPASVLLAQIIVESRGRYGNGLSLLAYQYHNLFGIKSFSESDNRVYMWNRAHTDGGYYRIFETHTECIKYRARMLTRPRYAQYTNGIDWKTKEGAQAWAQAVKNGGWAEASNYVSSLVEQMDRYDLYRYDTMSMNEAMTAGTVSGGTGAEVVEYACQFIGNRYVWGGESLTNGCDCSGFIMKVYEHFGVSMPHSSYAQRSFGRAVSVEDMQPGDIVCYSGHVGIYAGNGQIVNASNSKPYPAGGIKYSNVGYRTIVAVRRIF